uniref:(northern house mosquito) hypothetical protein n=1 Tax=Culex pipiens TaxID=7175 RepID=A0A8D8N3H9_CULPI
MLSLIHDYFSKFISKINCKTVYKAFCDTFCITILKVRGPFSKVNLQFIEVIYSPDSIIRSFDYPKVCMGLRIIESRTIFCFPFFYFHTLNIKFEFCDPILSNLNG